MPSDYSFLVSPSVHLFLARIITFTDRRSERQIPDMERMSESIDRAIDEWAAAVRRERNPAYQIQPFHATTSPPSDCDSIGTADVILQSREEVCGWFFRVVDSCEIDRGVVSVAASYFDRYVSLHSAMSDALVQLATMASLYLAVKLHSAVKISLRDLLSLDRGRFRAHHLLEMEMSLMTRLGWHLHPPTPVLYLDIVDPLVRDSVGDGGALEDVRELARYLLELGVLDGYFIDKAPSSVAYAAVVVAMDACTASGETFLRHRLGHSPRTTGACVRRLRQIHKRVTARPAGEEDRQFPRGGSPTSVI